MPIAQVHYVITIYHHSLSGSHQEQWNQRVQQHLSLCKVAAYLAPTTQSTLFLGGIQTLNSKKNEILNRISGTIQVAGNKFPLVVKSNLL